MPTPTFIDPDPLGSPSEIDGAIARLTRLSARLKDGSVSVEQAERAIADDLGLQRFLVNRTRTRGPLVTFGGDGQYGDISFGDVAEQINKLSFQIVEPPQQLSREQERERQNRQRIIQKMRVLWVEGVLKRSLVQEVQIDLGLALRPQAVAHPADILLMQAGGEPRALPPNVKILDVFNLHTGELLILGKPGAGKTMLLIDLASRLLDLAERDPYQPIPIVFNLSTWAERRSTLEDWLIAEMDDRYGIRDEISRPFIAHDRVIPLLDGLDEVTAEARADCIEAINAFRKSHGLASMVVCSRIEEYQQQNSRLRLRGAVVIQPLRLEQVEQYLSRLGPKVGAIKAALAHDVRV